MGVIYKLKEEIVDFIVQKKKANGALSCRDLVDIVKENFQVDLSKSSINKILKDSHLSCPVGRRTAGRSEKAKKFRIPEQKKRELFSAKGQDAPPPQPGKNLPPKPDKAGPERSRTPSLITGFKAGKESFVPRIEEKPGWDGMGNIFLKAAEWEISNQPVLGMFFKKYVKGLSLTDIDTIAEILLYLKPFGINKIEDIDLYKGTGLWALNGAKSRIDSDTLLNVTRAVENVNKLSLELSLEAPSFFTGISQVRFYFEDGSSIAMDPLGAVVFGENVQTGLYLSLPKSIQNIVEQFVENVQSAIFCSIGNQEVSLTEDILPNTGCENIFSREFISVFKAFEQETGKNIQKIAVFDQSNREITSFDSLPDGKKVWIGSIWPWQRGFEKLVWEGRGERIFIDFLNKELFYKPLKINQKDVTACLKGFTLSENRDSPPIMAVFTNDNSRPAEEVILEYIRRWPYLEHGHMIHLIKTGYFLDKGTRGEVPARGSISVAKAFGPGLDNSIDSVVNGFLSLLCSYCLDRFFPVRENDFYINSLLSLCYGISGYAESNDRHIKISLVPGQNVDRNFLESAIRIVNESNIKSFQNQALYINLKK